jgi:hypothetical protein
VKHRHAAQYARAIAPYGLRLTELRIAPYRVYRVLLRQHPEYKRYRQ